MRFFSHTPAHAHAHSSDPSPSTSGAPRPGRSSRVQRVRHELKLRELTVMRVQPVGAHFLSVTFGGEALADFVSASFDDHVKFMFEDETGTQVRRDYTPRSFDPVGRELTIEFALHGDGKASTWAQRAAVGQRALVGGPRGSMIIPSDYAWHFLAGDATALPAISRRVEELPRGARATVLVQVEDDADRRLFNSEAELDVLWVRSAEELLACARALEFPAGDGFVWAAGEASAMKRLRAVMVEEKGHAPDATRISAYWKRGVSDHHEHFE